ncbi:MAG: AraC family transcriptional regulator [Kiritimatiellae bacterium]|nr:AraC family transcriptional regulator [Kiritimatiellia bacterium]
MGTSTEGILIERIVLVDRITRRRKDIPLATSSLPGHLIQLTIEGSAHHESEGRVFDMEPGLVVWFCQDEEVKVRVTKAPWTFLTVNFIAPHLPPPPFDQSIRHASSGTRHLFENLLQTWHDRSAKALVRHIRVKARLLDLIADVLPSESAPFYLDPMAQIWWKLETILRERLQEPVDLNSLCQLSGRSARTLYRACHRATGTAPLKRIKKIRLSMARGLILHSQLNISEVAYRVGYDRVQELCRDYRHHFGLTPLQDRAAGPDYRRIKLRYHR